MLKKIRTRIKLRTWAISSVISVTKKVTTLTNALKSQKTSDSLGDFYVNNWKEKRRRTGIDTLHLISYNF